MLAPPHPATMYGTGSLQPTYGLHTTHPHHHGDMGSDPPLGPPCSLMPYRGAYGSISQSDKQHTTSGAPSRRSCSKWSENSDPQSKNLIRGSTKYPDLTFDDSYDEEADEVFSDEECLEIDEPDYFPHSPKLSKEGGKPKEECSSVQLLKFADMVSDDIHKFFGRRKTDEDSCDIYEEKWTIGKTGRELYYADLMRIAQGVEDIDDAKSSATCRSDISNSPTAKSDNAHTYSGKADKQLGLGPLEELFRKRTKSKDNSRVKNAHRCSALESSKLPLCKRKLPESFWKEPEKEMIILKGPSTVVRYRQGRRGTININGTTTPDFSDLLESWTGDEKTGELSSSDDVSSPSSETGSKKGD